MKHLPPLLPAAPPRHPLWMRSRTASLFIGLALASFLTACADESSPHSTSMGALNQGSFRYICLSAQDAAAACGGGEFPSALALGSRFDLDFDPFKETYATQVISAAPSRIAVRNDAWFEVLATGYTSVLALETEYALDFYTFRGVQVDYFSLHTSDSPEDTEHQVVRTLNLDPGESLELWAVPREAVSNTRLAGALDYTWTIDNTAIADISAGEDSRAVLLNANAPGKSLLRVHAGGAESTVLLIVSGSPDDTSSDTSETTSPDSTTDSQTSTSSSETLTDSASTDSISTDSTFTDSASTDSTFTDSTSTDSTSTDSASTDSTSSSITDSFYNHEGMP